MALQVGDGGEVLGARETLRPGGLDDMAEREMLYSVSITLDIDL